MSHMTVLAGGSGAAKFLLGLVDVLPEEDIHVVVNVADDHEMWGLHISPDIDRILYSLSGELDPYRGWDRPNETYNCQDTIRKLGLRSKTRLGDHEMATQLIRSNLLNNGAKLEEVTSELADRFGIGIRIMPASNDRVRNLIHHSEGTWSLQQYLARGETSNVATGISYEGAEAALAPEGVIASILEASRVILAPSDPVLSIGPILSIAGIRDALSQTQAGVVAISPVVGSQPVSGHAGQLMTVSGSTEVSVRSVAERYRSFLGDIVIHTSDLESLEAVRELGVGVWVENILINNLADSTRLARRVTNLERSIARPRRPN
jgi:LPPG:FO 2-phospho-L-lactate transferase